MLKQRKRGRDGDWEALTRLAVAALAAALLGASSGVWAAVSARLDRDSVPFGQPLTLTIQLDGKASGAQPDLAPLRKDFEVLGSSQSSELRILNFHRSDSVRWTVQLLPRHVGRIDLPPLSVGAEQTAALTLNVGQPATAPASALGTAGVNGQHSNPAAFIEVDTAAADKPVYVQQQLPYTVRLYVDGSVRTGDLRAPASPDAVIEQLGDDQRSSATVQGRNYTVIERHYAISPEKSGAVRISPASFRGEAVVPQDAAQGGDAGDDMMAEMLRNTPFANNPAFRNRLLGGLSRAALQPVGASAQPLTLDVRARPAAAQGQWLPAEQIRLHDSWADAAPQFKAGEPVTRTLTIEAKGLAASQIPPLALAAPANARIYPDAPDNQSRTDGRTIYGTSKQSVTYIPNAAGTLVVAPVDLAWWDTQDQVQRHAELPARSFQVAPGAASTTAGAAPAASVTGASPTPGSQDAATPPGAAAAPWQERAAAAIRSHWTGASAALALLLAAALAWWLMRRRAAPDTAARGMAAEPPAVRVSLRNLQAACRAGEREAAARALLELARAEWPEYVPRGLSELAQRLEAGADEVRALDRSLYGADTRAWDGMALWQAVGKGLRSHRPLAAARQRDGLAALYP